ncbi:hypothetical protein BDV26DRAFT_303177 [Aspergillus bertholletiae]|uniref:Uncharacterized protein n=1 Tax=Aspergillus bertholletiae TaxID=1226010 RepID=A0A5N7AMQ6_9EURO|nr:hypothetical protein BDV26DRAFT_303177 [Aspergillus bertholletiae]
MTGNLDYEIIRGAIPKVLAQRTADALQKQPKHPREKYDAFEIPPVCSEVRDTFLNNAEKQVLSRLCHPKPVPLQPDHIFAGIFRETVADPKKLKTAEKGEIYVTIALTPLSPANGWYTFYRGARANQSAPTSETPKDALNLDIGDAVVWRGDLIYIHSSGGGGMFQTIVYQID